MEYIDAYLDGDRNRRFSDWTIVYEYTGEICFINSDEATLEEIFRIFNIDVPEDYRSSSLSVGDIVMLNDRYYQVMPIGYREIEKGEYHEERVETND
jgi:hypothetical protein